MNRPSKARVLLADNHGILLVGVRKLIEVMHALYEPILSH